MWKLKFLDKITHNYTALIKNYLIKNAHNQNSPVSVTSQIQFYDCLTIAHLITYITGVWLL